MKNKPKTYKPKEKNVTKLFQFLKEIEKNGSKINGKWKV
jgi:hypothetical protein